MALKRTRFPFWGKWESNMERTANLLDKLGKGDEAQAARDKIAERRTKKRAKAGVA